MRVLVCGDRNWKNKDIIRQILEKEGAKLIIHGGCRGADKLASEVSKEMGISEIECPAKWDEHGNQAGPIRNHQMLKHDPDMVIGFHDNIKGSKGTKHMMAIAIDAGIPVSLVRSTGIITASR